MGGAAPTWTPIPRNGYVAAIEHHVALVFQDLDGTWSWSARSNTVLPGGRGRGAKTPERAQTEAAMWVAALLAPGDPGPWGEATGEKKTTYAWALDYETKCWWLVTMIGGEPASAFHPDYGHRPKVFRDTFTRWCLNGVPGEQKEAT